MNPILAVLTEERLRVKSTLSTSFQLIKCTIRTAKV